MTCQDPAQQELGVTRVADPGRDTTRIDIDLAIERAARLAVESLRQG